MLNRLPPSKENTRMNFIIQVNLKKNNKRMIPYPPNFSKRPAKIIEPPIGAST